MTQPHVLAHRQEWFIDPRSPHRRMCVTWHADEHLAVVSFWHAANCTATFRLPAADSARIIGVLADGLASGWSAQPATPSPPKPKLFDRLRSWLQRSRPSVAPFTLLSGGGTGRAV